MGESPPLIAPLRRSAHADRSSPLAEMKRLHRASARNPHSPTADPRSGRTREGGVAFEPPLKLGNRNDPEAPSADDPQLRLDASLEGGLAHTNSSSRLTYGEAESRRWRSVGHVQVLSDPPRKRPAHFIAARMPELQATTRSSIGGDAVGMAWG